MHALPLISFSPRRGSRAVLLAYEEDDWLRTVVDTVADAVATPRWRAFKRVRPGEKRMDPRWKSLDAAERRKALADSTKRGDLVELEAHEVLTLLEAPHPRFPGREYRKLAQVHVDLVGEAFLVLVRGADGRPVGWEVVPPHCVTMTPVPGRPSFYIGYQQYQGWVPESDVLWVKTLAPADPEGRGAGRGIALGDKLDTVEAIDKATKATFERGGIPAAIVGLGSKNNDDGSTTGEAAEDIQKKFNAEFRGPQNAGKVWFAPSDVTLAQVQVNYRELQAKELGANLRAYVRQAFSVPPELVGDLTSSNRAASESAKYHLAEYAVAPRLEFWRSWYQLRLVPLLDRDVILDYEDPRPQEWERTFRAMTTPPTEGVTWNEWRRFAGLPPLPELEGKRPSPMPGAGGGNSVESAAANATPNPPRDRSGEEGRV
ncbi:MULTISPECIES: phage portal protein [unclassified Corallococcus]|uniref:phage portal protein n=1 Tax=unclassified Corallococcus TaxID=2685029 RepID=UPI0022A97D8F|nr:phage portal protein [Corallococcus sp. NCRR]WAS89043.1 phage portal protein [Corallococcus sp. NCRR]